MLKRILLAGLVLIALSSIAQARNTRLTFKIKDVLDSSDYKEKVGNAITFYFPNHPAPQIAQNLGEYVTNKKPILLGSPMKQHAAGRCSRL